LVETFADFGLIGVALTLALLAAWLLAVKRIGLLRAQAREHAAERGGLYALFAVTVTFGVQSLLDWTWFIPGVAVPALLSAGWLAGRGPLTEPVGLAQRRARLLNAPGRAGLVFAIVTLTAAAGWMVWEPLRSADADSAAINVMERGDAAAALADARAAANSNPVSIDPLFELSAIYQALGNPAAAHNALIEATGRQPSNPVAWEWRAQFDVQHHLTDDAVRSLRSALRLDPRSIQARAMLTQTATAQR
jgi:tetratricopeptide (TPR) repeat protein